MISKSMLKILGIRTAYSTPDDVWGATTMSAFRTTTFASALLLAGALMVPKTADAAFLSIDDASVEGSIIFNVGQVDRGVGFVLYGTTLLAPSLGTASRTVSEGTTATGLITHTFTGQFLTGGALFAPTSGVIAFTEAGGGISDILTFSY